MLCNFTPIRVLGFLQVVTLMWCPAGAVGQEQPGAPRVITATRHDTAQQANPHATVSLAPPKRDPLLQGPAAAPKPSTGAAAPATAAPKKAVQVTIWKSFDGIGAGFHGPGGAFQVRSAPPDTNGAVGETQFVQWVNTDVKDWPNLWAP